MKNFYGWAALRAVSALALAHMKLPRRPASSPNDSDQHLDLLLGKHPAFCLLPHPQLQPPTAGLLPTPRGPERFDAARALLNAFVCPAAFRPAILCRSPVMCTSAQ